MSECGNRTVLSALLGPGWGSSRKAKCAEPGIACDYAQNTAQFVIMNLVQKPQKWSQKRYLTGKKIIFKNYASVCEEDWQFGNVFGK